MSSRPNPPTGCTEETSYNISDRVKYFRNSTSLSYVLYMIVHSFPSQLMLPFNLEKWHDGEITGEGGSSNTSKRYYVEICLPKNGWKLLLMISIQVKDINGKNVPYLTDIHDIRKISS